MAKNTVDGITDDVKKVMKDFLMDPEKTIDNAGKMFTKVINESLEKYTRGDGPERLYVFGTGHAGVTECYNTCFAIGRNNRFFVVDGGGGNGILKILKDMKIPISSISDIFVTHVHTDHILGVIWLIRMLSSVISRGRYQGTLTIHGHSEVLTKLEAMCRMTLGDDVFTKNEGRIVFNSLEDGEVRTINGNEVTFFDINAKKVEQFGFSMRLSSGKTLTYLGDEPFDEVSRKYVEGCDWLLSEAFCLESESSVHHPQRAGHSTVKQSALVAEENKVKNLLLWHTEDTSLENRKDRYTQEAQTVFSGNVFVPDDKEIITLD